MAGQNTGCGNLESKIQNQVSRIKHPESSIQHQASSYRPLVIPVFLPHFGCPHQCAFCNQTTITGVKPKIVSPEKLRLIVDEFLNYKKKQSPTVQIAFYGGNFLGLKRQYIDSLLAEAGRFVKEGRVDSIRFSTRPDTIDDERLDIINNYPVSTVEIGVQSMDDDVLAIARRGHTSSDTVKAICLLKKRNYEIGAQMMVGLPGDDENKAISTGRRIANLSPDFVRIYPTVVLANSLLAKWHEKGKYKSLALGQCVTLVKKLYLLFRKKMIPVIRMGLQASENLEKGEKILAGPYHPAFGHLVHSEIFLDMAASIIESENVSRDTVKIRVHPRSIPKIRGIKNKNIEILKRKLHIKTLKIIPEPAIDEESLAVNSCPPMFAYK